MQLLWLIAGCLALVLGVIGIVTPLLPTVPFLLLAALSFSKSSERLHNWLLTHPKLGPPIAAWSERRAISTRAKRLSAASMLASVILSLALGVPTNAGLLQVAAILAATLFIWTRPDA